MELSSLDNIRWSVEDALKFVQREVKRGNKYNGIILDPPAYGRGPNGEKWVLENLIGELMEACSKIVDQDFFIVLNMYSMGHSPYVLESLMKAYFPKVNSYECGDMYVTDGFGKKLPLGTVYRGGSRDL